MFSFNLRAAQYLRVSRNYRGHFDFAERGEPLRLDAAMIIR
jgi:hypothetical protein